VIRSQVNDGPVTTYKAGQSFSELPGDRHAVSANASETKPANLRGVRGGHERDGADNPIRELTVIVIASVVAAAPVTCKGRALAIAFWISLRAVFHVRSRSSGLSGASAL